VFSIQSCALPSNSLLNAYRADGAFADCYTTVLDDTVSHDQFVAAFYSSGVFKLERAILKWAAGKPSTDKQAQQLAAGLTNEFAAWRVEQRAENQLLLSDFRGRTRSWLMVAPIASGALPATRLYFGSAVLPAKSGGNGGPTLSPVFHALLGFHKIYSVVLLRAAKERLSSLKRSEIYVNK
jgi:hypothetical protein